MIVYLANKTQFRDEILSNRIEEIVHDPLEVELGKSVGASELASWKNSLRHMDTLLEDARIPHDAGAAIEFNIPQTGKRVDFIVTGTREDGKRSAVIVEMKQWQKAEATTKDAIVSTFVVGREREVINGALTKLDNAGVAISEEHLMMRPFSHPASGRPASKSRLTKYRQPMIDHAGIAIFVFGNKKDAAGNIVESSGMRDEFALCVASGVVPIPVGASGYMAETLWRDVDGHLDDFFPTATTAIRKSFRALGNPATTSAELHEEIHKIIHHLQKD